MKISFLVLGLALLIPISGHTVEIGVVSNTGAGIAITPSKEGDLLILLKPTSPKAQDKKVYFLTQTGGKKVIIINEAGDSLTQTEAWAEFSPEAAPPVPISPPEPPKRHIISIMGHD